jgi:SAM-dependent methyltransferase
MDSTTRFGNRADDYAKYRPTYPHEAVAAILDGFAAPVIADLGAGTGISAVLLAGAGATVYAIEPNAPMREQIGAHARITAIDGTAEATTLPDASIDIVTAFQAYHWFDPPRVFAEATRIGRRPVRFAAVWNERDDSDPFTRAYSEIIERYYRDDTEPRRRGIEGMVDAQLRDAGWSNARTLNFANRHDLDWEALIGRARSSSFLPREGPEYERMAAELRALYDRAADFGGARFVLVTGVHLAERQ